MIRVQFKESVNGVTEIMCVGISSDQMNDGMFLLQLDAFHVMEVNYKIIKHIAQCK